MKAVLWDMDGTLTDSESVHALAFQDAIKELDIELPQGFNESLLGLSAPQVLRKVNAATSRDISLSDWLDVKSRHYEKHAHLVKRKDEAVSILEDLVSQNFPTALVTNSTRFETKLNLEQTKIDHLLKIIVTREDVDAGKPNPAGYLLAAQKLNVNPNECLVVEDSFAGATAGINAGCEVIFCPEHAVDESGVPEGAIHCASPTTLPELIRERMT